MGKGAERKGAELIWNYMKAYEIMFIFLLQNNIKSYYFYPNS